MEPNALNASDQAVHDERAAIYGDATDGHTNLGLIFTALVQGHYGIKLPHPIPADVALLMMAGGKLNRASRAFIRHPDNYVDGKVYFALADAANAKLHAGGPPVKGAGAATRKAKALRSVESIPAIDTVLANVQLPYGLASLIDTLQVFCQEQPGQDAVDYFMEVLRQRSKDAPHKNASRRTCPECNNATPTLTLNCNRCNGEGTVDE